MANQVPMKIPTERPQPLTWAQIAEDVRLAKEDDVVFRIGRDNAVPSAEMSLKVHPANTSNLGDGDGDSSFTDPTEVRESCDKVLELLTLYNKLRDTPASLKERYKQVKSLSDEMNQSIEQLKSLSQTVTPSSSSGGSEKQGSQSTTDRGQGGHSTKGKSKHKKKK